MPYLFGLAAIRLWAILEAMIDDFVVFALEERPATHKADEVRSIKIPLADFIDVPERDRFKVLAKHLKFAVKANLKIGVGRFDALLDAIGMGGPIDNAVRRVILELSEVRNILVHRNGSADARIVENCPWLGLQIEQRVLLRSQDFNMYSLGALWMLLEMDRRSLESGGTLVSERQLNVQRTLGAKIAELSVTRSARIAD